MICANHGRFSAVIVIRHGIDRRVPRRACGNASGFIASWSVIFSACCSRSRSSGLYPGQ
jgi:hypothetical protein